MKISHKTWAIVLAGGEGTRLHGLTTDASGVAVPKQYCSLAGGQSLLIDTLQRAASVVEPSYICVVVAAQHRRWWEPICSRMPKSRIIVQPRNCGTGNGVMLPLLHILARDHDAHIVLLPQIITCATNPRLPLLCGRLSVLWRIIPTRYWYWECIPRMWIPTLGTYFRGRA